MPGEPVRGRRGCCRTHAGWERRDSAPLSVSASAGDCLMGGTTPSSTCYRSGGHPLHTFTGPRRAGGNRRGSGGLCQRRWLGGSRRTLPEVGDSGAAVVATASCGCGCWCWCSWASLALRIRVQGRRDTWKGKGGAGPKPRGGPQARERSGEQPDWAHGQSRFTPAGPHRTSAASASAWAPIHAPRSLDGVATTADR